MSSRRAPVESDRDPGLQPERTRLAWRRTTLSCAVVAVLAGRQVLAHGGTGADAVVLCVAVLVLLVFLRLARTRTRELGAPRPRLLRSAAALAAATCSLALALCGAALLR